VQAEEPQTTRLPPPQGRRQEPNCTNRLVLFKSASGAAHTVPMMIRSPCRLCWGLVSPHNPHTSFAKGLRVLVTKGRSSLVPVGLVILQGNTSRLSYLRSVLCSFWGSQVFTCASSLVLASFTCTQCRGLQGGRDVR